MERTYRSSNALLESYTRSSCCASIHGMNGGLRPSADSANASKVEDSRESADPCGGLSFTNAESTHKLQNKLQRRNKMQAQARGPEDVSQSLRVEGHRVVVAPKTEFEGSRKVALFHSGEPKLMSQQEASHQTSRVLGLAALSTGPKNKRILPQKGVDDVYD